jgi:alkylated DNA repair dioxygenase AlkB
MNNDLENQLGFDFPNNPRSPSALPVEPLPMPDADVLFYPTFFERLESDRIFEELLEDIRWRQDTIKYYGKEIDLPRLTAWYGDKGTDYTYSHIAMQSEAWTPALLNIKSRIENATDARFNSVLLNLYRTGKDGVSWHQDNEPELGKDPVIASVSFGEVRRFQFRHKFNKELSKFDIDLTPGSLIIIKGTTQQFWQHQIPKTSRSVKPRINLTFRLINKI